MAITRFFPTKYPFPGVEKLGFLDSRSVISDRQMGRSRLVERLTSISPAALVSIAVTILSILIMITVPVAELQTLFWGVAAVGFLIGDSVTTGYLSKFGLEEQERGYTRRVCGAEPTLKCAAGTRIIAFTTIFGLYILIVGSGFLWQYSFVQITAHMTPVVFGLMGIGATVINTYAMWRIDTQ